MLKPSSQPNRLRSQLAAPPVKLAGFAVSSSPCSVRLLWRVARSILTASEEPTTVQTPRRRAPADTLAQMSTRASRPRRSRTPPPRAAPRTTHIRYAALRSPTTVCASSSPAPSCGERTRRRSAFAFADFSHEGQPATLAGDLRVDGQADLPPLPAAAATAVSDGGYEVRKQHSGARPGQEASLRFAISKDGQTVQPEPYLGAGGHLVALREGDLAFLHVHPTEHGHDESTSSPHGEPVAFAATFPTAGRYRLFLQFKHRGTVHTVAFTQEVK